MQTPAKTSSKKTRAAPAHCVTPASKKPKKDTGKKHEDEDADEEETKKVCPDGMGGSQVKAAACAVCERPRESDQRGKACATCNQLMRRYGERSIPKVLANSELRNKIHKESLEQKPLNNDPDDVDLREKVAKLERLVKDLKRSTRK